MASFVLFLPASGGVDVSSDRIPQEWSGSLAAVGLDHLDAVAFSQDIPRGPDGSPGKLFTFDSSSTTDRGYDARTVWTPAIAWSGLPAGRYFVGYMPDDQPAPQDLASDDAVGGYPVELGDGNVWDLPDVADMPPGSVEPQDSMNPVFMFLCNALSQNYLFVPELAVALGLFDDDVLSAITSSEADSPVSLEAASGDSETDATPEAVTPDGADPWWHAFGLEVEAIASQIISSELAEDGGSQLSIVFASQLTLPMGLNTGAMESANFSLVPEIVDAVKGRVSGPGPVILLNDIHFELFPPGRGYDGVKEEIIAGAIHEIAHSLQRTQTFATTANGADLSNLVASIALDPLTAGLFDAPPDWVNHDVTWIRAALWLLNRFEIAGYPTNALRLGFENYGFSDPVIYQSLLAGEFAAYTEMPVRQIIRSVPMPVEFIRQFARDIGVKVGPLPQQQPATSIQAGARTGRPLEIRAASVAIRDEPQQPRMPIEEQAEIMQLLRENRRKQRAV
jgi:hypothetical protein